MPLTVIDPRSLDQTGDYTVNNITATGTATLSTPANLVVGGGTANQVLSTNGLGVLSWVTAAAGGGGGVTSYALEANLPVSATNGDLGYVTGSNKMYLYNGTIWVLVFTATTPNLAPAITAGPAAGYLLSTTGTPIVITMAAQDPEGTPVNWSYTITAGTLGSVATVVRNDNVFTITPSTNTANSGQFELTITASDGVNIANARTYFRLRFTVEDLVYGLEYLSAVPVPAELFTNSTNAYFGKAVAAHGGTLAVLSKKAVDGSVVSDAGMIHIYTTLSGPDPVYETSIEPPYSSVTWNYNSIGITQNMLVICGKNTDTVYNEWYVYYKTGGVWELTQTISGSIPSPSSSNVLHISNSGLVMVCGTPPSSDANTALEILIFTRDTTATTTWTLRQTLTDIDIPVSDRDLDGFPEKVLVSASGRHIMFSSAASDSLANVISSGKLVIFTNTNYTSGSYFWVSTYSNNFPGTGSIYGYVAVMNTSKYDDIFYTYSIRTNVPALACFKYITANNTWSTYEYSSAQVSKFLYNNTAGAVANSVPDIMFAVAGPNNSLGIGWVRAEFSGNKTFVSCIKFNAADLSLSNGNDNSMSSNYYIGTFSGAIQTSAYWWNSASEIPGSSNNIGPRVCLDDLTGDIFIASYVAIGGATSSGLVYRYRLNGSAVTSQTKTAIFGVVTNSSIMIPPNTNYISAVIIGGGGGGGGSITATTSGGGGGGGALLAFSNYPVVPGDSLTLSVGAGGASSSTRSVGSDGGSSRIIYNGLTWTAFGGAGGSILGGYAAGGTTSFPTISPVPYLYSVISGAGGSGAPGNSSTSTYGCGGGGAGGYGGAGGVGQTNGTAINSTPGSFGGGGGGPGRGVGNHGGMGGGTGVYGIGAAGNQGPLNTINGLSGSVDNMLPTEAYGGGAGGTGWTQTTRPYTTGMNGIVRIIFSNAPIYIFGSTAATTSKFVRVPEYTGT